MRVLKALSSLLALSATLAAQNGATGGASVQQIGVSPNATTIALSEPSVNGIVTLKPGETYSGPPTVTNGGTSGVVIIDTWATPITVTVPSAGASPPGSNGPISIDTKNGPFVTLQMNRSGTAGAPIEVRINGNGVHTNLGSNGNTTKVQHVTVTVYSGGGHTIDFSNRASNCSASAAGGTSGFVYFGTGTGNTWTGPVTWTVRH